MLSVPGDIVQCMRRAVQIQAEIDLRSVHEAVGTFAYKAAQRALAGHITGRVEWDADEGTLHGHVTTQGGDFFETAIFLDGECLLRFGHSQCTCPQRKNCEHAAILTLGAAQAWGQDVTARVAAAPWEQSLASLLTGGSGGVGGAAGRSGQTAIAIELSLRDLAQQHSRTQPGGRAPADKSRNWMLYARLVQPGKSGGWVAGQLSWTKLESLHYRGDYQGAHLRLLKELHWTYTSGHRTSGYYGYGYGSDQRYIDLAKFESRQLWPLLDEAASIGLPLIYPRNLGRMRGYLAAEFCLDLTSGERPGDLVISAVVRVDGQAGEVVPLRFIGSEAHGLVYASRADIERDPAAGSWRFGLAKLGQLTPPALQGLVLSADRLTIPAAERDRFCAEFYPRLRQTATVISSDESFSAPVISAPSLVLGAAYGAGHSVDVSLEWLYRVGEAQLRVPVAGQVGPQDPAASVFRDLAAEQEIVDSIAGQLGHFGLSAASTDPTCTAADGALFDPPGAEPLGLRRSAKLTGIDTMLFSTELLPLLSGRPGVDVEVTGDRLSYREASDSLIIGVSTGEIAGENDWFDLGITITVDGREVPFTDVFMALSRGDSHLLLDNGAYFALDKPELRSLAQLIEEARALQDAPGSALRISRFQAGLWGELAELGVVSRQAKAWQHQVDRLLPLVSGDVTGSGSAPLPATLTATLRPYQLEGFQWLAFLWAGQLGGILADDMGLGKTLQTLALICHARQTEPDRPPFLIVAPTSVVSNWAAEAARFAPGLKVAVITDTMARRGQDIAEIIVGADAVVTTYALLRIDFARYSAAEWSGLVLDEAQNVKNYQSKVYQCARRLSAPFKLAITGTPMENNLMELWSLLSITAPGLFPNPAKFQEYYARPIEKRSQGELLGQLRRRVKPLMKRRTKEQVAADLPGKQEQVLEVDLHPRHRKLYETYLQRERQKVLGLIGDMNANRFTIFRSLTLLRQLSLHAGLVDAGHESMPCSKLDALLEQLRDVVGGGHRALVFSQFTGFLSRVRARLDEAGLEYCYLDGKTTNRPAVLQRFKDGKAPVFLISLKAGGFGLNLTEADYCFLLDPWWNPAIEAQAIDRTHRIGQTRNVVVYRLISTDTIEEKVMALKAKKAKLFASVMDDGNIFGGGLDADDIRSLFA